MIFHRFINPKIYATRAEAVEDSLQHREEEELADDVVSTLINSCGDVCVCEGDWQRQHNTATLLIDLHLFWHNRNISTLMEAERDNESCERGRQLEDYRSIGELEDYVLLPVGCQDPLGLVVAGQPVDPALNQDQTELGVFVLQETNRFVQSSQLKTPEF